jgi:Ca2+-binding RTX toxin-like protein
MITVKTTRGGEDTKSPAERYRLKNQEQKSKTPFAIGLMLAGLFLYLKSMLPGWTRPQESAGGPGEDEAHDLAEDGVFEMAQAAVTPVSPETTGSVGEAGQAPGSGRPMIDLAPPARFITVDGPRLWDFFEPEAVIDLKAFDPGPPRLGYANDNPAPVGTPIAPGGTKPPASEGNGRADGGSTTTPPTDGGGATTPPGGGTTTPPTGGGGGTTPPGDGNGGGGTTPPGDPVCDGGPGSPCDGDDENEDEDDGEDEDCTGETPANRAPRLAGPVYLMDVTGCAVLVIALSDFLRGASDPDGDHLSITGLTVSAGTLQAEDGLWQYRADPFFTGPVTISYAVTDGKAAIAQTASFNVVRSHITGTENDDIILGTDCADDIDGRGGDDNIDARGGNNVVHGGDGHDHIVTGSGNDTIYGGAGNDIIFAGAGNDIVHGGTGNDRIFAEAGDDIAHGGDGDDFISGGTGNDIIHGGAGNDVLHGDDGEDILHGEDGNDVILGGHGNDVIFDGAGADTVDAGLGNDIVIADLDRADDSYDGGAGQDRLDYGAATQSLSLDIDAGTAMGAEIGSDAISGFEEIVTGSGDDTITDGSGSHVIETGAGDDTLIAAMDGADDSYDGGAGQDRLDYGAATQSLSLDIEAGTAMGAEIGSDVISGFEEIVTGSGDDTVTDGAGSHAIETGAGDDTVIAAMDGADDSYDGGAGQDRLDYDAATQSLSLDIDAGTATGAEIGSDAIAGFEEIVTGSGDDTVTDGAGSHAIETGAGDDTVIAAMDGADDSYDGGAGCDTLDYSAAKDCLTIDLAQGVASGIEIGADCITGFETVIGGAGDDLFILGEDAMVLTGGEGANTFQFNEQGQCSEPAPSSTASGPDTGDGAVPVAQPTIFQITDFKVGDKIRFNDHKLFEKVFDTFEGQFESVFGRRVDEDDFALRMRHETHEGIERTVVEADFNRDDFFETTIYLQGRHVMLVFEHA